MFSLQNLLPGTHLFCVYGDNWFQSVRYSCSIFIPPYLDMSGTPSAAWWQFLRTLTALQRSSPQKKSWQTRKKSLKPSRCCIFKIWNQNYFFCYTYFFLQSEFCEIKKKYDAARERLENDVKEITELIQVCYLTSSVHCTCKLVIFMPPLLQEREGAYTDYQDASALKYSHVPSASRFAFS